MEDRAEAGRAFGGRLIETMRAYRESQLLITCSRLGVFEALGGEQRTAAQLAASLALPEAPMTRLLNGV